MYYGKGRERTIREEKRRRPVLSEATPFVHPPPLPYSHYTVTTQSPHSHYTVTTQSRHEKPCAIVTNGAFKEGK